jgi:hypothetical protein
MVIAYFAATGRALELVQAVFGSNQCFTGSMAEGLTAGFTPSALVPRRLWCTLPLVVLAIVGAVWSTRAGRGHVASTWLAYAIGTAVAVALPGRFFPHYYQLWLPVYCIGAGIGFHAVAQIVGGSRARRWRDVLGALTIGVLLVIELPSYAQRAEAWSLAKYGPAFVEVKRFAPEVAQLLAADETLFEWGDETGFYYYTRRAPPARFLYLCIAVVPSPQREQHEAALLADLRRSNPELLIMNARYVVYPDSSSLPVTQWMSEHYYRIDNFPRPSPFALFLRAGGPLEQRLHQTGRL